MSFVLGNTNTPFPPCWHWQSLLLSCEEIPRKSYKKIIDLENSMRWETCSIDTSSKTSKATSPNPIQNGLMILRVQITWQSFISYEGLTWDWRKMYTGNQQHLGAVNIAYVINSTRLPRTLIIAWPSLLATLCSTMLQKLPHLQRSSDAALLVCNYSFLQQVFANKRSRAETRPSSPRISKLDIFYTSSAPLFVTDTSWATTKWQSETQDT